MKDDQPMESLRRSFHERDNYEPADADELLSAIQAAKTGNDPDSAHALMREILMRTRSGDRSILPYLENWIIHAFGKIIEESYSADQAFGLKPRQGKHARPDTQDRDIIATALVILAIRAGNTWECAIDDAANRLFVDGAGDAAVKAAYSKYRDSIYHLSNDELTALIPS